MSDLQAMAPMFRSMEAAVIFNQGVQAADMAARQAAASHIADAQRKQAMVNELQQAGDTAEVGDRDEPAPQAIPAPRRRPNTAAGPDGREAPGSRQRIDLIA